MKLTMAQIKQIQKHTPENLKGTYPTIVENLGFFQKADANWSYWAGWTKDGILVVTVYGKVI